MAAIISADLGVVRSEATSATPATNGGRKGYTAVLSGINGSLMPDVPDAERVAGSTLYRKGFFVNNNGTNAELFNPKAFMDQYTIGADAAYMIPGTQTNFEADLTGSEQKYGCGQLSLNVSAGATQVKVQVEDPAILIFAAGMKIRISDRANPAAAGNSEYLTITGTPSIVGDVVTINVTTPLVSTYSATNTRVSSVMPLSNLVGTYSGVAATTAGDGDYTPASNLIVHNIGGVYDTFTLTFTSSSDFTCAGTREGSLGTGSRLSNFSPVNAATGTPYFDLGSAGFTGAWAAGDTLQFTTSPAAAGFFIMRVVPPNAAAMSGNKFTLALDGETA